MSDAKDDIYLKSCDVHVFVFDWYSFPGSNNVLSLWIKFVMIRFYCLILIQFGDDYIKVKKKEVVPLGSQKGDCMCYVHVTALYMSTLQKIKGKFFAKLSGNRVIQGDLYIQGCYIKVWLFDSLHPS